MTQNLYLNVYASAKRWHDSLRLTWITKATKVREAKAFHDTVASLIVDKLLVPATSPEQRAEEANRVYVTMAQLESLEIPEVKGDQFHVLLAEMPLYVTDSAKARDDETPLEKRLREAKAKKAQEASEGGMFSF